MFRSEKLMPLSMSLHSRWLWKHMTMACVNLFLHLMLHFGVIHWYQLINLSLEKMFITPSMIAPSSHHLLFATELYYVKSLKNLNPSHHIWWNIRMVEQTKETRWSLSKKKTICLFKELNLDFMIVARWALGHSCINPAKRIMSILNLGLQNIATEPAPSDNESTDKKVKKAIAWWSYENVMEKYLQLKKLG